MIYWILKLKGVSNNFDLLFFCIICCWKKFKIGIKYNILHFVKVALGKSAKFTSKKSKTFEPELFLKLNEVFDQKFN